MQSSAAHMSQVNTRVGDAIKKQAEDVLLAEGWAVSEAFYQQIGMNPSANQEGKHSWDELYAEAIDARFAEKGMIA